MELREAITAPLTAIKKRVWPEQQSSFGDDLIGALNNFTNMQFENVGDFLGYYQSNYFQSAYTRLTPFTCHQLAIANPYITSAINAIAEPISSAEILGVPLTPETTPVPWEEEYLTHLLNHPNPYQPKDVFIKQLIQDKLQTGSAFVEVNYNDNRFPARLDRVPSYKIQDKRVAGETVYIRSDNGYIYPENSLIPIFNPNPYSTSRGLSPMVPLFINILTDTALMEHNLRYFVKDTLKGIINISDNIPDESYVSELERIRQQIREMESTGDSGHLVMHGATFQSLGNSNRDMMTPDILQANIAAICAVYHVPPHKIMKVESGNLGTGTGESQEDAMNETINNEASNLLSYLNFKLLDFAGIQSSKLAFKDLTKTDELRQATLDTERLGNGSVTLNEVRQRYGDELYEDSRADEPWFNNSRVPLSMVGQTPQGSVNPVNPDEPAGDEPVDEPATQQQRLIEEYLKRKGLIHHV